MISLLLFSVVASATTRQDTPAVMHFCAQHCLTFTRESDGRLYNYTNLALQHDVRRVFEIQHFTPDSVVILRTDYGSNPGTAVYAGRMDPGNSGLRGTGWRITWGAALHDIPGTDAERDSIEAARVASLPLADRVLRAIHLAGGHNLLVAKIQRLRDGLSYQVDQCARTHDRSSTACENEHDMERDLAEARGDLRDEIDALNQVHASLAADCAREKPGACDNQAIVDAWLADDRDAQ